MYAKIFTSKFMSKFSRPNLCQNFYVKIYVEIFMSKFMPKFSYQNLGQQFQVKFLRSKLSSKFQGQNLFSKILTHSFQNLPILRLKIFYGTLLFSANPNFWSKYYFFWGIIPKSQKVIFNYFLLFWIQKGIIFCSKIEKKTACRFGQKSISKSQNKSKINLILIFFFFLFVKK